MLASRMPLFGRAALAPAGGLAPLVSCPARQVLPARFCAAVLQKTCYAMSTLNSGYQLAQKFLGNKLQDPSISVFANGKTHVKPKSLPLSRYLRDIHPKTFSCDVEQLELSYYKREVKVSISSDHDWHSFYELAVDQGELTLYAEAPQRTVLDAMKDKSIQISGKFRAYFKKLLDVPDSDRAELDKVTEDLKGAGFLGFESKAVINEELGISRDDWHELVDTMVSQGLPVEMGKAMKLAAKNKRGSKKNIYASQWTPSDQSFQRTTYYMRLQVFPVGEDDLDIVIALNQNRCLDPSGGGKSDVQVEQHFKNYMHLDSQLQFKKEVRPLLEDDM